MRTLLALTLVMLVILLAAWVSADVRLPHVFGDHMVLQRQLPVPVWGWAAPGEQVSVQLDGEQAVVTTADAAGKWQVKLPAHEAGPARTLTVTGANQIVFTDVVFGEVWLCSGQSNMEWSVGGVVNAAQELAAADRPNIRQIKIPHVTAGFPQEDVEATWQVSAPNTVGGWTAVGYFFAVNLEEELGVPIGLLNSSWGGSAIDPWVPFEGYQGIPTLTGIQDRVRLTHPSSSAYKTRLDAYLAQLDEWLVTARAARADETVLAAAPAYPADLLPLTEWTAPTTLYNAMLNPLVPYAMRGSLWYQGESNHGEGMLYVDKTKALIEGWRAKWGLPNLTYYYVQIAPYRYGEENPNILPEFWEAQAAIERTISGTGQVLCYDVGNIDDIHPTNKQVVGKRMAALALANDYGQAGLVCRGPRFSALELEGNELRVRFTDTGSGLVSRDGKPLSWFEIIGPGTDWTVAKAVIEGDSVVLSAPEVTAPTAVRFGWNKIAEPNLSNVEGFPALQFRAGEVPKIDYLALKVPQQSEYQLVYDLNLTGLNGQINYDVDNSASIKGPIDRVAYFLELKQDKLPVQYAWTSMKAFTQDPRLIGVPTVASGAVFQQLVEDLEVISNVTGVQNGTGLGGNLEFWPHNYGQPNAANVPNASASLWDFGDQYGDPAEGYGSMQVGNYQAGQVVWAFNSWRSGSSSDIGIGNSTGETRDWTFARNASSYTQARLRVLVKLAN